jgi:hypothetical protein
VVLVHHCPNLCWLLCWQVSCSCCDVLGRHQRMVRICCAETALVVTLVCQGKERRRRCAKARRGEACTLQ